MIERRNGKIIGISWRWLTKKYFCSGHIYPISFENETGRIAGSMSFTIGKRTGSKKQLYFTIRNNNTFV